MAVAVLCPSCRRRLNVPENLAGQRVTCPSCEHPLRVPPPEFPDEPEPAEAVPAEPVEELALSVRLGIASLTLALLSVLVLCLPVLGYLSLGLSSIGLMLGLLGLARKYMGERGKTRYQLPAASPFSSLLGQDPDFSLAGTAACLLALALALLPFVFR
jgi:hypothetical protein